MRNTIISFDGAFNPDALLFEYYQHQDSIYRNRGYNQNVQKALLKLVEYVIHYDLSDRQRECVWWVKIKGLKAKNVAVELGISESTVCRNLQRAQKKFDKAFEHYRCVKSILCEC